MSVTLNVIGSDRKVTLDLPEPRENILHEVVRWQLARRRRGTASTKTRAAVVGSTAKIWPQKGTGRARHGSRKAPIFVGGGQAFGPKPRCRLRRLCRSNRVVANQCRPRSHRLQMLRPRDDTHRTHRR